MAQPVTKGDLHGMERRLGDRIDASIGELARMTKDGFDAVDKRFNGVDLRFIEVEGRLDRIDHRLGEAAYRFEVVEIERRVDRLEHKVGISGT